MSNATTTLTVYTKTLTASVLYRASDDEAERAMVESAIPGYIARLTAALPEGVELVVNDRDHSIMSIRDDGNGDLATAMGQMVDFWA